MSSRAKRKLETRLRGGPDDVEPESELFEFLNEPTETMRARIGVHDVSFDAPVGFNPDAIFRINASTYDLWNGNAYEFHQPGPVTPIRNAGTKARAVRLRGMVGVLQDSLHQAGVWPWLDGRKCVRKPWELTTTQILNGMFREMYPDPWPADRGFAMEGLLASTQRQGVGTRFPDVRVTAINRDTRTITVAADGPFIPAADTVVSLAPVPTAERKKPRYAPPPTRLDGRRKR